MSNQAFAVACLPSRRTLLGLALFALSFVWSGRANAYPWMIRHGYTACTQCHADPSGGGLLTASGRIQSEELLRSHYAAQAEDEGPGTLGGFLLGVVPLPGSVLLGGDYRGMVMYSNIAGTPPTTQFIQMQADVTGQLTFDHFRFNGSLGYDHQGAEGAWLTSRPENNLVARVFWAGYDFGDDEHQFVLRVGRLNLPYGIRQVEHTLFVHSPPSIPGGGVRDDTNQGQEYGAALAYNAQGVRAEVLAIAGNYSINPDMFRERGYSGYAEWDPWGKFGVGVSSLITYAKMDPVVGTERFRHAHGVFARTSPWKPLVLLFEADVLAYSQPASAVPIGQHTLNVGDAWMLQADFEVWQGLHLIGTGEMTRPPTEGAGVSYGGWGSLDWFFAPHADIRFDAIRQSLELGPTPTLATTVLFQLHAFL